MGSLIQFPKPFFLIVPFLFKSQFDSTTDHFESLFPDTRIHYWHERFLLPLVTAHNALTGQESPLTKAQTEPCPFFNSNYLPRNPVRTKPFRMMPATSLSGRNVCTERLFLPPCTLSPLCCIPRKMITWRLGTDFYFFFFFLRVRKKKPWWGIIGCNCSPAGALLKDSYPSYGCWTALSRLWQKSEWQPSSAPCWVSSRPLGRWMCHTCVSVGAVITSTII